MAYVKLIHNAKETGLTGDSKDYITDPRAEIITVFTLTAGSPATGCVLQFTISSEEEIIAGTAVWRNSPMGYSTSSNSEGNFIKGVRGVRLDVTDGTWTFQVNQVVNTGVNG